MLAAFFAYVSKSQAATLSVSPTSGQFTVGSTFEVSLYLNSEDQQVNAIEASLGFPPDMLQLVSPSTGKSVIGVWTAQPSVNNQTGRIDFQGGIPGGIKVSSGLVTTLSFRVKAVGRATVKFLDNSKVLLHDGKGTNILSNTANGVFDLVLPPPAGPLVVSETHPNQSLWYKSKNVVFSWAGDDNVEGYSYILNTDPADIPDDTVDSKKTSVVYRQIEDGQNYFHIKALRKGSWGGTTHFAVKTDSAAPADFPIKIIPSARTTRKQPIFEFASTDRDSGINHYEMKLVDLNPTSKAAPLFVEVNSPYVTSELGLGKYAVIIRAYDNAGNYVDVAKDFQIVTSALEFVSGQGLQLTSSFTVPWRWFWPPVLVVLINMLYFGWKLRKWHLGVEQKRKDRHLPDNLKVQLEELKKYREKFGSLVLMLALSGTIFFSFLFTGVAKADTLTVPSVSVFSREISNQEIFYAGGRVEIPETEVIVYLQNKETGETFSHTVVSDKKGEWFYRHSSLLPRGKYSVWVQAKLLGETSSPGPEHQLEVSKSALQFGSSRLSYDFIYVVLILVLLCILLALVLYSIYNLVQGRKKHKLLKEEIQQAEESIKRGFAVLRRDLQAELELLKKSKIGKKLTEEEKKKEQILLQDLADTEAYVEKELWQIEHMG